MDPSNVVLAAFLLFYGIIWAYSMYEMWTLPDDAEEWEYYKEAWEMSEDQRRRFL